MLCRSAKGQELTDGVADLPLRMVFLSAARIGHEMLSQCESGKPSHILLGC